MTSLIIFAAGLVVGWNMIPQPQWVKNLYDKAYVAIKEGTQTK